MAQRGGPGRPGQRFAQFKLVLLGRQAGLEKTQFTNSRRGICCWKGKQSQAARIRSVANSLSSRVRSSYDLSRYPDIRTLTIVGPF